MTENYLGYVYKDGKHGLSQRLRGKKELTSFLIEHLYAEEVVVTDTGDECLFWAVGGIDMVTKLEQVGIDINHLYQSQREGWVEESREGEEQQYERQEWEVYYDSIGLSPQEAAMRQRAKAACQAAETLEDVAELLQETYFIASFYTEDEKRFWSYFDQEDYSASEFVWKPFEEGEKRPFGTPEDQEGHLVETNRRVILPTQARVCYRRSSEDNHYFTILDPPPKDEEK